MSASANCEATCASLHAAVHSSHQASHARDCLSRAASRKGKKNTSRAASSRGEYTAALREIKNRSVSVAFRRGLGIDPDVQKCTLPPSIHESFVAALKSGETPENVASLDYTNMTIAQIQDLSAKAIRSYDFMPATSSASKFPQCALPKLHSQHRTKNSLSPRAAGQCRLLDCGFNSRNGFRSARGTFSDSKDLNGRATFLTEPLALKAWNLTVAG